MSFRKEIKFKLTQSEIALVQKNLAIKGMRELYASRIVNSCYFDNKEMSFFHDSEEGVLPRKKVRIRWYNSFQKYKKETKISSIEGRFKLSEDIFQIKNIEDIFTTSFFDPSYGKLSPKLIVNYKRQYYKLDKLRITLDTEINYMHILSNFIKKIKDDECIMEIKAPIDCHDDYIQKIINYQNTRFSKYSRGLVYFNKII
jgi:hypothetical protein